MHARSQTYLSRTTIRAEAAWQQSVHRTTSRTDRWLTSYLGMQQWAIPMGKSSVCVGFFIWLMRAALNVQFCPKLLWLTGTSCPNEIYSREQPGQNNSKSRVEYTHAGSPDLTNGSSAQVSLWLCMHAMKKAMSKWEIHVKHLFCAAQFCAHSASHGGGQWIVWSWSFNTTKTRGKVNMNVALRHTRSNVQFGPCRVWWPLHTVALFAPFVLIFLTLYTSARRNGPEWAVLDYVWRSDRKKKHPILLYARFWTCLMSRRWHHNISYENYFST